MLVLCSGNTSPDNSVKTTQKGNTETNTTAVRGHETYTCATENPELGIFWTGKQTNHKTYLKIFMTFFFFFFTFIC